MTCKTKFLKEVGRWINVPRVEIICTFCSNCNWQWVHFPVTSNADGPHLFQSGLSYIHTYQNTTIYTQMCLNLSIFFKSIEKKYVNS